MRMMREKEEEEQEEAFDKFSATSIYCCKTVNISL